MPAVKQQSAGTGRRAAHPPRVPWEHGASNRKSHTPAARSNARRRGVLSGPVWLSPRVRGKLAIWSKTRIVWGSPPRVRGGKAGSAEHQRCVGITPACAGKSCVCTMRMMSSKDHPRVCGEKSGHDGRRDPEAGSPPRVRGKDAAGIEPNVAVGITPACAGKSPFQRLRLHFLRDHPRACREKPKLTSSPGSIMGSPPRVRGKAVGHRDRHIRPGITPACAGKRSYARARSTHSQDHPRVCGEKRSVLMPKFSDRGLPPRVRGKEHHLPPCHAVLGITPACAGKSSTGPRRCPAAPDHPRVCGEKSSFTDTPSRAMGSPPRVRGKGDLLPHDNSGRRITPACAGKSCCVPRRSPRSGDHPRVCGEKAYADLFRLIFQGSPPRVRGKAPGILEFTTIKGITPACAGKRARPR